MLKRINFDLDGVVCDFVGSLEKRLPYFKRIETESYSLVKQFSPQHGLRDAIQNIISDAGFWANLEPYPGAIEAIGKLALWYRVRIITAPWRKTETNLERQASVYGKWAWLDKHLPGIDYHIDHRKSCYGADFFIEDRPSNLSNWHGKIIVFDQPYNRKFKDGIRCKNWEDILSIFLNWKGYNYGKGYNSKASMGASDIHGQGY